MLHQLSQQDAPLILVAEDNKTTQRTITIFLKKHGYRVIEVENGQEAINAVEKFNPDLLLMDIFMPEMDGCVACDKIMRKFKDKAPPIVMITALDEREAMEQAFSAGAIDYITKPIEWTILKNRILIILQERQASKALEQLTEQYKLILSTAGDGIIKMDKDFTITFANPSAENKLGWSQKELIGKDFHSTLHHTRPNGESCELTECPIYISTITKQEYRNTDELLYRKNGSFFLAQLTSSPIIENDRLVGAVLVFTNLTKKK